MTIKCYKTIYDTKILVIEINKSKKTVVIEQVELIL